MKTSVWVPSGTGPFMRWATSAAVEGSEAPARLEGEGAAGGMAPVAS